MSDTSKGTAFPRPLHLLIFNFYRLCLCIVIFFPMIAVASPVRLGTKCEAGIINVSLVGSWPNFELNTISLVNMLNAESTMAATPITFEVNAAGASGHLYITAAAAPSLQSKDFVVVISLELYYYSLEQRHRIHDIILVTDDRALVAIDALLNGVAVYALDILSGCAR